jgi:hypothetical protein
VGLFGGVVEVGEREDGERGGFVGHGVGVGAPHHDRALLERLDEADGDGVAVAGQAWGDELSGGERECDLEPERSAGDVVGSF